MPANGVSKGHKIPQQYWEEMYKMYASGTTVSNVHKKVTEEWKIECSERTVYTVLRMMRDEKRKQINELLESQAGDDVGRLNWLQEQLEEIAVECRFADIQMFMKAADRLIRIHSLKLAVRANNLPAHFNQGLDEEHKAKLIEELTKIN